MTAKKTGEFSGKPGRKLKRRDQKRLAMAYEAIAENPKLSPRSAVKRACLLFPDGLEPPVLESQLKSQLKGLLPGIVMQPKIKLKSHLSRVIRDLLEAAVDRLENALVSNMKHYESNWIVATGVAEGPDHDADVDDSD